MRALLFLPALMFPGAAPVFAAAFSAQASRRSLGKVMPKRSLLEASLVRQSAAATWRTQQRQSGEETGQQRSSRPSGAFCRKLAVAQAPFRNSFLLLQAPATDEQSEDTAFAFANMRLLLHTVAQQLRLCNFENDARGFTSSERACGAAQLAVTC